MNFLHPFRQRPLRSSLLLLQIFFGSLIMTLALSAAFSSRVQDAPPERFNLLAGYEAEGTSSSFGVFLGKDLPELRELAPDVEQLAIVGELYDPIVVVGDTRYALRSAARVSAGYFELEPPELVRGTVFTTAEVDGGENVALLSEGAAKAMFGDADPVGQSLIDVSSIGAPTPHRVIGTFADATGEAASSAPAVYFPIWAPSSTHNIVGPFAASQLFVRSAPGRSEQAGAQLLTAVRRQYRNHPQLSGVQPGRDFYLSQQNDLIDTTAELNPNFVILGLFGVMALTIGSIGVFSSTVVSVTERSYEIGIKRALGATGRTISREFAAEALLISLISSLLGAGLAAVTIPPLIGLLGDFFFGGAVVWRPFAALTAVGVTVALAGVLGTLPAYQIGRLKPFDNLRS